MSRLKILIFATSLLYLSCKKEKAVTKISTCIPVDSIEVENKAIEFITVFSDIKKASEYRYNLKDDKENVMDCLKIVQYSDDLFVGVSHVYNGSDFVLNVAISNDLINWEFKRQLAKKASQPCIYITKDKKILIAWEQEPSNHLKVSLFTNLDELLAGKEERTIDIKQTFSALAEGTPNIYCDDNLSITIGFHYFNNGKSDRNAIGTLTDFNKWTAKKEPEIDKALIAFGNKGNIGDRDNFVYKESEFIIIEAQEKFGDFGTWQCYLYHKGLKKAWLIPFKTHAGSKNFANPTISIMNLKERRILVLTAFIPSEKAGINENGEMICYFELP
jgi:hypothetical protein